MGMYSDELKKDREERAAKGKADKPEHLDKVSLTVLEFFMISVQSYMMTVGCVQVA